MTAPSVEAAPVGARPALDAVWQALGNVPDPEVPVLSIVELGIVRGVHWEGETLRVRVTPTYSGCPATDVIHRTIRDALAALAIERVAIEIELSPPWSTDWIAPEAKSKLRAFGIAPPGRPKAPAAPPLGVWGSSVAPPGIVAPRIDVTGISPLRRRRDVACPRCDSTNTSLVAQFGSTACKALYRCEDCREPFDHMKPF